MHVWRLDVASNYTHSSKAECLEGPPFLEGLVTSHAMLTVGPPSLLLPNYRQVPESYVSQQ